MNYIQDESYYVFENYNLNDSLYNSEWILPDGFGGWASQSISSALTRRYHSLFLLNSEQGKINFLPKIEEFVDLKGRHSLSTNIYSDTVYPDGFKLIDKVFVGPTVRYFYQINNQILIKEIIKGADQPETFVTYHWLGSEEIKIELVPLFSYTGFHSLRQQWMTEIPNPEKTVSGVKLKLSGYKDLYIEGNNFEFQDYNDWYYNFKFIEEQNRGLDSKADLFTSVKLSKQLKPNQRAIIKISLSQIKDNIEEELDALYENVRIKSKKFIPSNKLSISKVSATLDANIDNYLINTNRSTKGVVAGYHWFEEWGRDTFIFLYYLSKEDMREKSKDLYSIFNEFVSNNKNGVLPNRFISGDEHHKAEYNSVDALLWCVLALNKFHNALSRDKDVLKPLWNKLYECINSYAVGTDYSIKYIKNDLNLLFAGDEKTQLTWMDARVGGRPITPRNGACVEINALWYNSLRICEKMSKIHGLDDQASYYNNLAQESYLGFRKSFLLLDRGYLADRVDTDFIDYDFRPNQIFAMSLPYPLLEKKEARQVLLKVEKELLSDFGIRTLNPSNKNFKPSYIGSPEERDSAYHQGTAWPWLLGHYADAVMLFCENDLRPKLEYVVDNLSQHVFKSGCGHVSEVFGGDDNKAGGAIAQAWSTAALRYCIESLK